MASIFEKQIRPVESDKQPADLDAWKKDYPKSREEADAQLEAARKAYYGLEFFQGIHKDTPPKLIKELMEALHKRYSDFYTHIGKDGLIHPAYDNIKVPLGFEEWAVEKIRLAGELRDARHRERVYTYRIAKERDEIIDAKNGMFSNSEGHEIASIMGGNFEVVVQNGIPELKLTSQGELWKDLLEKFMTHHNNWTNKHRTDLLAKFPKLSSFLEVMDSVKELGVVGIVTNLESIIYASYSAHLNLTK